MLHVSFGTQKFKDRGTKTRLSKCHSINSYNK